MADDWEKVKAAPDDDWAPVSLAERPAPDVGEALPEAFMGRIRAGEALARVFEAAGKGASEGAGPSTPTGFEDDTLNYLIEKGVFHDPATGRGGPLQMANEAVLMPAAQLWQGITRAVSGGIHGAGGAMEQLVTEFGGSQGEAARARREVINLGNWAMIEGGMGRFSRPTVESLARDAVNYEGPAVADRPVGGLPTPQDFAAATRVLTEPPKEGMIRFYHGTAYKDASEFEGSTFVTPHESYARNYRGGNNNVLYTDLTKDEAIASGLWDEINNRPINGSMENGAERLRPLVVEQNLRRMWAEDGIHPAEAVHDAQTDAFVKHEITAPREEISAAPKPREEPSIVSEVTQKARGLGSYMDIAERWVKDPEGVYADLDAVRQQSVAAENALKKKYGVKKVEDLEDEPLTDAERHFLFYETAPTSRESISEITQQLQPVDTLPEAAKEIAYEFRRLPSDVSDLNHTEQLAVMRLQVLFSEVERLGGDLNETLKQAGQKYGASFGDPEDAIFMMQNAADSLKKLFAQESTPAIPVPPRALPMPKEWNIAPEEMEEAFGKRASLSAAVTEPGDVPLDVQPPQPAGSLSAAATKALDTLFDVGRDIQMKLAPMARGSMESMATVKDYMNAMRRNAWDSSRIDTDIMKRFSAEQRERMARAMEEESLSLRLGEPDSARAHQGLATLEPEERQAILDLDAAQQLAWLKARDVGLVEGDGIPMHFPRMALGAKGDSEIGKPPSLTQMYGIRKNSPYLKKREYMEAGETERALKAKYGEQATIAWDIRAVNLATKMLEDAIAGRTLINNIEEVGKRTGDDTVAVGFKPADGWFTVDHPAFQKWRPKIGEDGVIKDEAGNPVFEQVPIYVRGDFEGPIRAALWGRSGEAYKGLMALKGKTMGLIMNSPAIHNLVEFGRAMPAMPIRMVTPVVGDGGVLSPIRIKVYADGFRAKNDPAVMHEAIDAGLVPIGKRFFNQDIDSMMEAPDLTPGRSITAKALALVPGLFDEAAGVAVKRAIDKAGDFWHNTLLWDKIADLQAGLYVNIRGDLINHRGMDPQTASRIAAHYANRYAGALPKEAMSEMATKVANTMLFSRSFTLGNLGVMKDMLTGLPKDVLAQIERDAGFRAGSIEGATEIAENAKTSAAAIARRKAISIVTLDVALMYAGNSLLQSAFHVMLGQGGWSEEGHEYLRRLRDVVNDGAAHPLSLLNPLWISSIPGKLSATADNEPGRQNRIMIGTAKDGTGIYARNPVGKIGDEFAGYFDGPIDMLRKKEGTIARPLLQIYSNDAGFGRKVYDPHAETLSERAGVIGAIAKHLIASQLPVGQISAFSDLVKGEGDKLVNMAQAFGPFAGVTFSKGAPGGTAVGEMYAAKTQHEFAVNQAMPDIRRQIKRGDVDGAIGKMTELDIPQGLQRWYIKTTLNPALRMSPRAVRDFYLHATDEQKQRFERARK